MGAITVRVNVLDHRRTAPGYWVAGRHWPVGVTTATLEDQPGLSVEQQLRQLEHARGGQVDADTTSLRASGQTHAGSPALLEFEVVDLEAEAAARAAQAAPSSHRPTQHNSTGAPVITGKEEP